MILIDDWKRVAPKLWSVRLSLAAALLTAADVGFELWAGSGKSLVIPVSASIFSLSAAISRIVSQPGLFTDAPEHDRRSNDTVIPSGE